MSMSSFRVTEVDKGYDHGWSFTPLKGKVPVLKGWTEAERETRKQALTWAQCGNVGLRTGQVSGVVVVDVDRDKGGQVPDNLPETVTAETRGGGCHFYFRAPSDGKVPNSSGRIAPHVDVRGDGGQVVYPGSIHPDTGVAYRWADGLSPDDVKLAEIPSWLLDRMTDGRGPAPRSAASPGGLSRYVETALHEEVQAVAQAPEGQRNETLNKAAFNLGQLVAGGCLASDVIESELLDAARTCGLYDLEAQKTIASGLRAGREKPRKPDSATLAPPVMAPRRRRAIWLLYRLPTSSTRNGANSRWTRPAIS